MKKRKIANSNDLESRITELETLREKQKIEFKDEFRELAHRFNPTTLIKNSLQTVVGDPGLQTAVIDTAISQGAGRLGKKLIVGKSHNVVRKLAGSALHFLVVNFIRNRIPVFRRHLATHKKSVV